MDNAESARQKERVGRMAGVDPARVRGYIILAWVEPGPMAADQAPRIVIATNAGDRQHFAEAIDEARASYMAQVPEPGSEAESRN